jgi:hypothetical protein
MVSLAFDISNLKFEMTGVDGQVNMLGVQARSDQFTRKGRAGWEALDGSIMECWG